jgi:hypothetical protein
VKRIVQPEYLDQLPPADPQALRSRRDLRRLNALMRHPAILAAHLRRFARQNHFNKITELGAGDGKFLLCAAQKTSSPVPWQNVTLLDFKDHVSPETLASFKKIGWQPRVVVADVFQWPAAETQIVVSNLFLHHFETGPLQMLLSLIAQRAELFIAIEPRRCQWSLAWSQLLGLIGCNAVTRHDAVVSVKAGFAARELSGLWPGGAGWQLTEKFVPPFSHLFVAQRVGAAQK